MLHTGHEYPILQSSLARNGLHCELFILIPSHISWPQYPRTRFLPLLSHSRTWPGCHLIRSRDSPGSGRRMYPRGTLEFACMWILWYHPVLWVYESLQFCGKIKQCCQQWNSAFFSTSTSTFLARVFVCANTLSFSIAYKFKCFIIICRGNEGNEGNEVTNLGNLPD